ncbi:MAG: hypothetical protein AAFZ58_04615 [Pseudomonadota bacterium]
MTISSRPDSSNRPFDALSAEQSRQRVGHPFSVRMFLPLLVSLTVSACMVVPAEIRAEFDEAPVEQNHYRGGSADPNERSDDDVRS